MDRIEKDILSLIDINEKRKQDVKEKKEEKKEKEEKEEKKEDDRKNKKDVWGKNVETSVVQIITDHLEMNYSQPWQHSDKKYSTGTGFCIEWNGKKYIITNAHCVDKSTYIKISRRGYANLFYAEIVWIIYECDL